jgi:hypothetical protein
MTRCIAIIVLMLWGWPAAAYAQADAGSGVAASFEQLQVLVKPGNTVTVTDAAGSQVSGRIESLSPSVLSLDLSGARRDFSETDVNAIRQRRGDSLANGARWGFGVGAGLASLVLVAFATCDICDGEVEPGVAAAVVGLYGAMGAGIGVGIDALIRREQTIFRRPGFAVSIRF